MYRPWNKLSCKRRARVRVDWDYEKDGPMMARIPIKLEKSLFKPPVQTVRPQWAEPPAISPDLATFAAAMKEVYSSDKIREKMLGSNPFLSWDPERWAWEQAVQHAQRIAAAREEWPWPEWDPVSDAELARYRYYGRAGSID